MSNKKLFIVVNVDWFFLSHRLPIGLEALKRGYDVTIIAIEEEKLGAKIRSYGFKFIPLPSTRGGKNIYKEIKLLTFLYKLYRKEKPDIIHHVAVKPVIYGSIAAKYAKSPKVVNAVSGLGSTFINPKSYSITYNLVKNLYSFGLNNPRVRVIVQNTDDEKILKTISNLKQEQIHIIKGSGVDLTDFSYSKEEETSPIRVLLLSRMLWDKGIGEFEEAARLLKSKYKEKVEFILAGKVDKENASSISQEQLDKWNSEGNLKWINYQKDVIQQYRISHIAVLPSYREGLPKSLIEALAIGRPVITTDVPGCKDVVRNNENGILVPVKDSNALADAMNQLISDKALRIEMGIKGREFAQEEFSIQSVIEKTFDIYEK